MTKRLGQTFALLGLHAVQASWAAGVATTDTRISLGLTDAERIEFLAEMRQMLASIQGIVAGIGLLQYRSWARVLALILAFFNLLAVPHGTVFGVYTLISLLNTDAAALFDK